MHGGVGGGDREVPPYPDGPLARTWRRVCIAVPLLALALVVCLCGFMWVTSRGPSRPLPPDLAGVLIAYLGVPGQTWGPKALDLQTRQVHSLPQNLAFVTQDGRACLLVGDDGCALATSASGVRRLSVGVDWDAVRLRQAAQVGGRSLVWLYPSRLRPARAAVADLVTGKTRLHVWSGRGWVAAGPSAREVITYERGSMEVVDLLSGERTVLGRGLHPCVSRDGRIAYVDASLRSIDIRDAASARVTRVRGPGARLGKLAWAPDGVHLGYEYELGIRGFNTYLTRHTGIGIVDTRTGRHYAVLPAGGIAGPRDGDRSDFTIVERMPSPELLSVTGGPASHGGTRRGVRRDAR